MDSARFDGLVRSLSQARSRRQTLRGLAGIAASGAVALSGRAVSAQACKSDRQGVQEERPVLLRQLRGGHRHRFDQQERWLLSARLPGQRQRVHPGERVLFEQLLQQRLR
jgi:hypothetical protein